MSGVRVSGTLDRLRGAPRLGLEERGGPAVSPV